MFLKIIQSIFRPKVPSSARVSNEHAERINQAAELYAQGNSRQALEILRKVLQEDPYHVPALTTMGACLADIGDQQEAMRVFELAYSLDDHYLPAVVNNARMLADKRQSPQALPFLRQAKAMEANFAPIDNVYASICHTMGKIDDARHFHLRAWLSNFDNLRLANSYLFNTAYADIDERELAAEHFFWAETVQAPPPPNSPQASPQKREKIRIGYWSPDLRNHSVRYFFRPLLENQDRDRFEIFIYHDSFAKDLQTEHIAARCDAFHDVYELTDQQLGERLLAHGLDILVELAGHTSSNRLPLLKHRLATVQITALGYPPTTGLATLDGKLLDRYLITPDHAKYYAEMPMVLPSSFWCFDPMEEDTGRLAPEPPCMRNAYVTFGCIGNIAKINQRTLDCWREILRRVPRSRLLIRSISFEDAGAEASARAQYLAAGLPMERVDLRKPEGGQAYFESYNDIDIVLDTSPFNGGTTTCFAVYMGVPVVSWAGDSLISRMGLSILANVGAQDLVVSDSDAYIRRAVALSQDIAYLQGFKQTSRQRMRQTALGNGQRFARDFEQACSELLEAKRKGVPAYRHAIDLLPANELVRRAYGVLRRGQDAAAQRILAHCLQHYPDCGSAHILATQSMTSQQQFAEAAQYLLERMARFSQAEQIAALVNVARCQLLSGQPESAVATVAQLAHHRPESLFDQCQVDLCRAHLAGTTGPARGATTLPESVRIHCLIPCDELARFQVMQQSMEALFQCPPGWKISYARCAEALRLQAYQQIQQSRDIDVLVLIQKNIDLYRPDFLIEVVRALEVCNVVGFAGATSWDQLDWIAAPFEDKAGGLLVPSREKEGLFELQVLGGSRQPVQTGMAVLDGGLLAMDRTALSCAATDPQLQGAEALLEQAWSHAIHRAGGLLGVHQNLGILLQTAIRLTAPDWATVRLAIAEQQKVDVLARRAEDYAQVSWPVQNPEQALNTMENYLS